MREPIGLILAGGQGTRMGTVSKGDVTLGGQRLLDLCTARLDSQVSEIIVNANDPLRSFHPVIADTMNGFLGPLAGVLAGLEWAAAHGQSHVVTVAVDTPFFPCDLVPRLLLQGEGKLAIAATSESQHATFGIWPVALRSALLDFLKNGGRKVRAFTALHDAAIAVFPDATPSPFFNINTRDDLALAETWI